jgi:hypothetical protein|tara:strand:- start:1799 stop:1978 length:180 start_codon:yes stop_codon:yes gene_type:complete
VLPSLLGLTTGLKSISATLNTLLSSINSHFGVRIVLSFARILVKFLSKQCSEEIELEPL